jgi:hypothetical protein
MPIAPETVTLSGSGLVFNNTYGSNVNATFRTTIVAAENYFQGHFTNAVTLTINFDALPMPSSVSGSNIGSGLQNISYASLSNALRAHETTANDFAAVASLPATDPTHGQGFSVPVGMARILGLVGAGTGGVDQSITLNSTAGFTYGADALGVIEHEISEGAMGRIGGLGLTGSGVWAPIDLFRYTASGQRDYSGGRDGQPTYFSVDGVHITQFQYHNSVNPSGTYDGFDFADWNNTTTDAFGPGGPGAPTTISATDLQVLDILGWTPTASSAAPPVVSVPSVITVKVGVLVAINYVSVADADAVSLGETIAVTITASSGSMSNPGVLQGSVINSPSTHSMSITGSLSQVNSDLASIALYLDNSSATRGTIVISASDEVGTGSASMSYSTISRAITPAAPSNGINPLEAALIDTVSYLANNLDVARAGLDPAVHFTQFGWKEGRNPDPLFDVGFYLSHNPDVAASGIDPLLHYATFGWKEGRDPSATFSTSAYLAHNGDVKLAGMDPLQQYLNYGINEGRGL